VRAPAWTCSRPPPALHPPPQLIVTLVVEDEKIGLQDLEESITAMEDQVQSVDLLNMSKVSGR